MTDAVLFFCHGSRDPRWRQPFDQIVQAFQADNPTRPATLAFLELMQPDFSQALDALASAGAQSVDVFPLFLAPGRHTNHDLHELVTAAHLRWPQLAIRVAPTLTEDPRVRAAIVAAATAGV